MDIKWALEPTDIEWEMDWVHHKATFKDREHTRDLPDKEMMFEKEAALAHLLMNEVIFLNSHWWEDKCSDAAKKMPSLNVNCSDVFAWGCADAESLPYDQLETLYRMWCKDPHWGPSIWCMLQRKQMPQKPVEKSIRTAGIWDLEKLGLGENTMDAECHAYLQGVIASGALRAEDKQAGGK